MNTKKTARKLAGKEAVRCAGLVRRLGGIGKQIRINTTTGHIWAVWVIILSNGRKLCECETESAAKRIYKALSSPNKHQQQQK